MADLGSIIGSFFSGTKKTVSKEELATKLTELVLKNDPDAAKLTKFITDHFDKYDTNEDKSLSKREFDVIDFSKLESPTTPPTPRPGTTTSPPPSPSQPPASTLEDLLNQSNPTASSGTTTPASPAKPFKTNPATTASTMSDFIDKGGHVYVEDEKLRSREAEKGYFDIKGHKPFHLGTLNIEGKDVVIHGVVGSDHNLNIFIYKEGMPEGIIIKQYRVPLKKLTLLNKEFLYESKDSLPLRIPKKEIKPDQTENNKGFFKWLVDVHLKGNIDNLSSTPGVEFRSGTSLDSLKLQRFGPIEKIAAPTAATIPLTEDAEVTKYIQHVHDTRAEVLQHTDWFKINDNIPKAKLLLIQRKIEPNKGSFEYKLITLQERGGKQILTDYYIAPKALQKILDRSPNPNLYIGGNDSTPTELDKINAKDNINKVRDFLIANIRFDTDTLTAFSNTKKVLVQLRDIPNVLYQEKKADTLAETVQLMIDEAWKKDPKQPQGKIGTPISNSAFKSGILPDIEKATDKDGFSFESFTNKKMHISTPFKIGDKSCKFVIQDEYTTIYTWKDGEYKEYIVRTQRILDYISQKTQIDYSSSKPSTSDNSPESIARRDELVKLASVIFKTPGIEAVLGNYYFHATDTNILSLSNKEFDVSNDPLSEAKRALLKR